MGVKITGAALELGSKPIPTHVVSTRTGVSIDEILEKTGIEMRWYLNEGESLLDIAASSVRKALPDDTKFADLMICATYAHDLVFPSLASRISAKLGLEVPQLFDLQSNCTGFINALCLAHDRLVMETTTLRTIVVAAESNSPFIDALDASSAMFWSDGAGAIVLESSTDARGGILSRAFHSDTTSNSAVRMEWSASDLGGRITHSIVMGGLATWRQATSGLPHVVRESLEAANLQISDIDHVVFHQANLRMLEYLGSKLRIPEEKMITNVSGVGNLGAASIPVALADANILGRFRTGDKILMAAVGAGYSFAALIWEW